MHQKFWQTILCCITHGWFTCNVLLISHLENYIYRHKRSFRNITFSQASVCLLGWGGPMWPLHPPSPLTWDLGTYPLLLTSGGLAWRPVYTCSLEDLPPTCTGNYWWPPKHVWLASGRWASCWNTVLLNEFWKLIELKLQNRDEGTFIMKYRSSFMFLLAR